jgi:hypothetical protein
MEPPFLRSVIQVIVGGALVLATGAAIGSRKIPLPRHMQNPDSPDRGFVFQCEHVRRAKSHTNAFAVVPVSFPMPGILTNMLRRRSDIVLEGGEGELDPAIGIWTIGALLVWGIIGAASFTTWRSRSVACGRSTGCCTHVLDGALRRRAASGHAVTCSCRKRGPPCRAAWRGSVPTGLQGP